MSKREILRRLQSQSPEHLLNSPYARYMGLDLPTIQHLLAELNKNWDEAMKPLLLADVSCEIESIALNSFVELSDREITRRSILTVEKLLKTA
jgi:hypothetical protein